MATHVANTTASPLVVNVWPGKTVGDVGIDPQDELRRREETWVWKTPPDCDIPGEEYHRVFESSIPGLGPLTIRTNVSKPTLTIYRPPREKNTGTAMLICPGGGYHNLLWDLEGVDVAVWAASVGITGILLKYRVPQRPDDPLFGQPSPLPPKGPLLDAQRAVSLVRSQAAEWGIHPQRIGIVGFSAGGNLALRTAASHEQRRYEPVDAVDRISCRPDFAISCYTGYMKARDRDALSADFHIPPGTPPIFLAHCSDDSCADVEHSVFAYLGFRRAGIPAELHVFAAGEHDFGVRQDGRPVASWMQLCLNWLRDRGLMT